MPGYIVLEGGAEFGGRMDEVDRRAIELAGGSSALISIIPTAAAADNNHQRAGGINDRDQFVAVPLIPRREFFCHRNEIER